MLFLSIEHPQIFVLQEHDLLVFKEGRLPTEHAFPTKKKKSDFLIQILSGKILAKTTISILQ